jgi:hypothetical protein
MNCLGPTWGEREGRWGPRATPASNSPTTAGIRARRQSVGISKKIAMIMAQRTRSGRCRSLSCEEPIIVFACQLAGLLYMEPLRRLEIVGLSCQCSVLVHSGL